MELWQPIFILSACIVLLLSLYVLFRPFGIKIRFFFILLLPIILFTAGFMMRLSETQAVIDTGYYLTDASYIIVYIVFATSFLLGQIKYYKTSMIKNR